MNAETFAALGQPSRLQIAEFLRGGPSSVGEISDALDIRQPQVSKHLRVLSEAGIAIAEKVARKRIYHLEAGPFNEIAQWVGSFEKLWNARLDSLDSYLDSIRRPEDHRG
jgi:DNA-binding transcriptional ArsR family regulator